jgi:transcriptional regulator with GAF, ATPase, and Fis domain
MLEIEPNLLAGRPVSPQSGPPDANGWDSEMPAFRTDNASLETVERNHILAVLEQTAWRIDGVRGAAQILELHPNT